MIKKKTCSSSQEVHTAACWIIVNSKRSGISSNLLVRQLLVGCNAQSQPLYNPHLMFMDTVPTPQVNPHPELLARLFSSFCKTIFRKQLPAVNELCKGRLFNSEDLKGMMVFNRLLVVLSKGGQRPSRTVRNFSAARKVKTMFFICRL